MKVDVDVAVVGAGAAGLAAAAALARRGFDVLTLEARDRAGGRAETVTVERLPLDLGCGWLHSADRNPLVAPIREAGFRIETSHPSWGRQTGDRGFSAADQDAFAESFDAFERRLAATAAAGIDRAAADDMAPGDRWNPLIDAVSSYYNGTEFDRVSTLDYDRYVDTGVNWRVPDGYGAALLAAGRDAPVALGTRVLAIDDTGSRLAVETTRGTLRARAAILALPTSLLAGDAIGLPAALDPWREAAAGLPLGLADKLFFALPEDDRTLLAGHYFGRTDTAATGSYHVRPFGRPYVEVFLGGQCAAELERAGDAAAFRFAADEIAGLFGAAARSALRPLAATRWGRDPLSRGSYSHALPGRADARLQLARPAERIAFAGEATHVTAFSTAHGAWESGLRAADEVGAMLGAGHRHEALIGRG